MKTPTKLQKFISFLLIFSILFSFTINVKFFGFIWTIFASDVTNYNLVSIFVEEEIYSDVDTSVKTYAENIQKTNENTKVIIIPTPKDEHPFNIASVNEKLYFEWEESFFWNKWNSKLVWTVFVWDLALPVVEKDWTYEKTVFPYVDFEDKYFIYDHSKKIFTENKKIDSVPKAEIWHWFISPNTWDESQDISKILDYFEKNNNYYSWKWLFDNSLWVMNWKKDDILPSIYEPYVFYYDQFRESKAVNYVDYKAYETYLDNIEDITYKRYSKDLAKKMSSNFYSFNNSYLSEVNSLLWNQKNDITDALSNWTNIDFLEWTPDIQSKAIIDKAWKKLINIFNQATLWGFYKDVHNAWRYNKTWDNVNVDLIPYLATNVDFLSQSILKNVNTDLEKEIDKIVKNWLSRNIAIPTVFNFWYDEYTNFYFWKNANDITNAWECSIYKWSTNNSWTLVWANRAYNIWNITSDIEICKDSKTNWYWWWNSPLNLDTNSNSWNIYNLNSNNYKWAISPIYDIKGALKTNNSSFTPSPNMCFDNNLLLTKRFTQDDNFWFTLNYSVPVNWNVATNWSCSTDNYSNLLSWNNSFESIYKNFPINLWVCETQKINLSKVNVKTKTNTYSYDDGFCYNTVSSTNQDWESVSTKEKWNILYLKDYNFKKISSFVEHKSPSYDELNDQSNYMVSPNLPIDKDRYIDFIAADNTYAKINYPYLFRLGLSGNLNLSDAKIELKKYLDNKSKEINDLILEKSPTKILDVKDKEIYDLLKTWNYPSANIDLYKILENKQTQEIEIFWEKKQLKYIDMLLFSLYWNNLNSVSAKYKFIMENYLSDQFWWNNYDFFLPKNKKQYEISYLWSSGDAQNMYVKLDPEDKWDNPYDETIWNYLQLNNSLIWNRSSSWNNDNFKCSPPEWVPIWQWMPSVMCRLKDMLPPKISVTNQSCWINLNNKNDSQSYVDQIDDNKNWINDFFENEISAWSIKLKTDWEKYYYNSLWNIEINLLNSSWGIIYFDNLTNIKLELYKLEWVINPKEPISDNNKKIIYDKSKGWDLSSDDAFKDALNYISFKDINLVTKEWKTFYNFSSKSKDANITFKATLTLKDLNGNVVIKKEDTKDIKIRWDIFYSTSHRLEKSSWDLSLNTWDNYVISSTWSNIFLVENKVFDNLKNTLPTLGSLSTSKEKLFISLINKDKNGNDLPINYPINLKFINKDGLEVKNIDVNKLDNVLSVGNFKNSWTYTLLITDKFWYIDKKEIDIVPDNAVKILPSISTNLIEKWGVITTNAFTIYDQYNNPTVWDTYRVEAVISWNSLTFEDWNKNLNFDVIEWFKPFRLKTTQNIWKSTISFRLKKDNVLIDEQNVEIQVLDKINFEVSVSNDKIKVWNNTYNFTLKVNNSPEWANFNSRVYLISNWNFISSNQDYIDLKNNFWTWSFNTKLKSIESTRLEFKVEWVKDSLFKDISILPDLPIKVDILLSKSKIEASNNSSTTLFSELKDQYNNTVWNDNTTLLNLEINNKYSHIIKSNVKSVVSNKWKWSFTINWTDIPWSAYFKVSTSPNLSNNKVEFPWQRPFEKSKLDAISGMRVNSILTPLARNFFEEYDVNKYRFKIFDINTLKSNEEFLNLWDNIQNQLLNLFEENNKIIINWFWENAWKIETYYFWNKDKINWKKYNSIYTTLLWSNYWDITVQDNLANSLIFDKNNRSLWVTSLLNTWDEEINVLNLNTNWNLGFNKKLSNDLSQDISVNFNTSNNWNLELTLFNNSYWNLVSRIEYNLKNSKLVNCTQNFSSCVNEDANTIGLKVLNENYKVLESESWLSFVDSNNKVIVSFSKDWKISKDTFTKLELSDESNDWLTFIVKNNWINVWSVILKLSKQSKVDFTRDISTINSRIASQSNGWILVYIDSRDYYLIKKYSWSSTREWELYSINYNDPFASDRKKVTSFNDWINSSYESFENDKSIWWEWQNKTLLLFAWWNNIWESTKNYMSFWLINIWDPLVSLKHIKEDLPWVKKDRKFDSSIGYLISKDENNIWYTLLDYNNDGIKDIAIQKRNWYIDLMEGTNDIKKFINRWNLIYIKDISSKSKIISWDFSWDWYDDIVIIDKNRNPVLFNNDKKDFTRINLNLWNKWFISQILSYDMDLDWKFDLVTLDDAWEININYGTSSKWIFEKSLVWDWFWVNLLNTTRSDLWVLYFDWLPQQNTNQTDYIKESDELKNAVSNSMSGGGENDFNFWIVDKLIYSQLTYWNNVAIRSQDDQKQDIINNLPDISTLNQIWEWMDTNSVKDFINNTSEQLNPWKNIYESDYNQNKTTFIKTEYAKYEWIEVEKNYIDENWQSLKWWDNIRLNIKITNKSWKNINSLAYADIIPSPLTLIDNPDYTLNIKWKEISKDDIIIKDPIDNEYAFLIDSYKVWWQESKINLSAWESIYLTVLLKSNAFSFGHIEVWKFDDTTKHWDIIFKNKDKNCWQELALYKSISSRSYQKNISSWANKSNLPDAVKNNSVDKDWNWVPDYIDKLTSNTQEQINYSKEKLNDFININNSNNEDIDILWNMQNINNSIDKISTQMDSILAWLKCWFWWGGCISTPINVAPLAPWSSFSLFWIPFAPAFPSEYWNPLSWIPVFSSMTSCLPVWNACIPFVWPPIPGWWWGKFFWTSWLNNFRVFITPTLTWAVWTAICFWNPLSSLVKRPPWVYPMVPWWNCIVAATPFYWCKNDWSDWELSKMWTKSSETNLMNWNCSSDINSSTDIYLWDAAKDYITYKKTWKKPTNLVWALKDAFKTYSTNRWRQVLPSWQLLSIWWWIWWKPDFSLDVDFEALKNWNFSDVVKVQMKRVSPFPDFLMEWTTRQIEEITNKLVDFPSLNIILPDMSWINWWFDWFMPKLSENFNSWVTLANQASKNYQDKINKAENEKKALKCDTLSDADKIKCFAKEADIKKLEFNKNVSKNAYVWWIKSAYEFIWKLPMISVETQKIQINIPWIDSKSADRAITDFTLAKDQRSEALKRAQSAWDPSWYGTVWNGSTNWKDGNREKIIADTKSLISSIDKNIETLKDYKNFPVKIHKMLNIKESRINQILCNIEWITKITWWRIWDNWKRFKSWVELYILIKWVLKWWQLFIDVFYWYKASCMECKNERRNLQYILWKLISGVIPKIPVIQFPKWPNIYLDLHNIRLQLVIKIPEFNFSFRPIVIPSLPRLYLPSSPNANITLPKIPLLPRINLLNLPDLPALPKVELPNLPPPPKLPKLLSSLQWVLNIIKLVTKIECFLKSSFLVPEWRAWDQIAFMTERTGFLSFDFLDLSLPQFSFPFIDAIKVTSFVNLEVGSEFMTEMARQTVAPLNSFWNDMTNIVNIWIWDLDFRNSLPIDDVNVKVKWNDSIKSVPDTINIDPSPLKNSSYIDKNKKISLNQLSYILALNLVNLSKYLKNNSKVELTNEEFKKEIISQLVWLWNEKVAWLWSDTLKYSFVKEDKLINELVKNNNEKFNEVKSILMDEKSRSNKMMSEIENYFYNWLPSKNLLLSSNNNKEINYNQRLEKYNNQTINSLQELLNWKEDDEVTYIRSQSKEIFNQVKTWLNIFEDDLNKNISWVKLNNNSFKKENLSNNLTPLQKYNYSKDKVLALNDNSLPNNDLPQNSAIDYTTSEESWYSYIYKWIYVIEKFLNKEISYLLFDYTDELLWTEKFDESDFDSDWDSDSIYMIWNEIFIKENLIKNKTEKNYYSWTPEILNINNNKFYQLEFIESVNWFNESNSDNWYINVNFNDSTSDDISWYNLEFYDIIDKFSDVNNWFKDTYLPKNTKKYVIDSFRDIDEITKNNNISSNFWYTIRKNLAYISSQWIWNLNWIKLTTKEIKNLKNDIDANNKIIINAKTKIYSSNDNVKLNYYLYKDRWNDLKLKNINLDAYSNVSFDDDIVLVWLDWYAFIEWKTEIELLWNEIISQIWKPLLPWSYFENLDLDDNKYIKIKYYDWSSNYINFSDTKYFEVYDLWNRADEYLIRTSIENNFYYWKIRSFKDSLYSTYSNQIIISPQKESDQRAPEIVDMWGIKVPVYQQRNVDISQYIFEDSWIKNIKKAYIDFDLEVDSDWDWDSENDKDYESWINNWQFDITKDKNKIILVLGPYDKLYDKKIRLFLLDDNNNIWYKDIPFLVYAPVPNIKNVQSGLINWYLDELLEKEPVSIYRFRNWNLDRIKNDKWVDILNTTNKWIYEFKTYNSWSLWLELTNSWTKILKIDENTWKIIISDIDKVRMNITYKVYPSNNPQNDLAYPKIVVYKNQDPIYYEYIKTPDSQKVEVVDWFWLLNNKWVYYKHIDNNFWYIQMPLWISKNSWDLFLYSINDIKQSPIIKIYKDWRVDILSNDYYLEYDVFNDYVVFNIKNSVSNSFVWKIMLIPEKNFVIK